MSVQLDQIDQIKVENDSKLEKLIKEQAPRSKWLKAAPVILMSIAMSVFHIYTSAFGILEAWRQRSVSLSFVLLLIPFYYPLKRGPRKLRLTLDSLYFILVLVTVAYLLSGYQGIIDRDGAPNSWDLIFGTLTVLLVVEGTRRAVGNAMSILIAVFIAYIFFGNHVPGILGHPAFTYEKVVNTLFNTTFGVFGLVLGAMSNYIIIFIIFGAFLAKSEAGRFFIKLAFSLTGSKAGGPAKVAVVASGLMGMISGNAVSNVVTTGALTIPLMKQVGYKPEFAGGVEAASSAGGQIMPPVMGAAAFIIASNLQIPYIQLCLFALIPAILHYVAIYTSVHLEARKTNLKGIPKEDLPKVSKILKEGWFLLIPVIAIVWLLVIGRSPQTAGFYATVLVIVVSSFRKQTRMTLGQIIGSLEIGAKNAISTTVICAAAGILIGSINLTGLGMKFSSLIMNVTGQSLLLSLFFTMIASLILGMGMPTVSAYVILAVLGVPALVKLGVPTIAAHLFVFYFSIMSNLTPPVAVGAYAAAAISHGDPVKTGFSGMKIALSTFLIPYAIVYGPALVLQGTGPQIFQAIASTTLGVISLSSAAEGWMLSKLHPLERLIALAASISLIYPGSRTDLFGLIALALLFLWQWRKSRKNKLRYEVSGAA